jgi:3-hydroxybutyryl-CoA dehydrogenase
MGLGIAQVSAVAGHKVSLYDIDVNASKLGLTKINANLEKLRDKNKLSNEQYLTAGHNIQAIESLEQLQQSEIIIEAVKEDYSIKEKLFTTVSALNEEAVIATNTSALSVTKLTNSVKRPERFIGMHFMNPVPVMPLVEIIEHNRLHHSALDFARQFCESLQKQVIKCQDSPGFIVNRLLLPMINQAIILLEQGIATVEDIDIAMRLGANFPMGPLTLADFIGLDTCLFILQTLYQEGDNNFVPPSNLLVNMVKDGKLGKKSGKGFYNYISIA